ncbi:MAG: 30S ribosome-binding factor RbfA [Bacteroidetes bacterium]|nr:30S ribosome-binding factor RbfA [Bacteroidota bacterium]
MHEHCAVEAPIDLTEEKKYEMSVRTEKVGNLIKAEFGRLIERDYRTSEMGFMTVTKVSMSPDLRLARIYISVFGDVGVKERTLSLLNEAKKDIRHYIAGKVRLKFAPEIAFFIDDTMDYVASIEDLLKKAHTGDDKNSEERVDGD